MDSLPLYNPDRFYLGTLCKRGHDFDGEGHSLRTVSRGDCSVCTAESKRRWAVAHQKGRPPPRTREEYLQWRKERYEQAKAADRCVYCGGEPLPGKTKCAACNEKKNESQRERNQRRGGAGLCQCGKPSAPWAKRCESCLTELRLVSKKRHDEAKTLGLCKTCRAQPAMPLVTFNH